MTSDSLTGSGQDVSTDPVRASLVAEIQPQQHQEYPRDEWRRRGRRQTDRHTDSCVEEVAFLFLG